MENKIKYYLDETDQIEVDGHTLSRLYLAESNYSFSPFAYAKGHLWGKAPHPIHLLIKNQNNLMSIQLGE